MIEDQPKNLAFHEIFTGIHQFIFSQS